MNYKTLVLGTLILLGCSSPKPVVEKSTEVVYQTGNRPKWVNQHPSDPAFYIGVAVASKTTNPTTYATVAQRNALNELASSIEVKVKSNSMLFSFEEQNAYRDEFKEFVQVKTNQNVENYEQVAIYENDLEYWVYYRLSKEQYQKDKAAKINKAINLSVSIMNQAEGDWSTGNYRLGMIHYFDALQPIKPYLGEPLETTINGTKDVYLGNFLLSKISQGSRVFQIHSVTPNLNVKWGGTVSSDELQFQIQDFENRGLAMVPVKFKYSEGIIRPREGVTNEQGIVFTHIDKVPKTAYQQNVMAEVDFRTMVKGDNRVDEIDDLIFDKISQAKSSIQLSIESPTIYVNSIEKHLDKKKPSVLKDAFELEASKMGFVIVNAQKEADLVAEIKTNTRKIGEQYDLKNVLLNGTVLVKNKKTQAVIYQEKFSELKGVSSTYVDASVQSYSKAMNQVSKKTVPRLYRKYTR